MTLAVNIAQGGSNNVTFRNRIINGGMVIDQRNAGASVTIPTINPQYTLDRWAIQSSQASKISIQQDAGAVTPPTGFTKYLGATSLSAYSVLSGDYFSIRQGIEGFNIADLGWGAAGASPVTLSFWVRSSLTGTFGGSLTNNTFAYSYPFTYTISVANTWEYKTITVAGPTAGTWETGSSLGIYITLGLGIGSTYSGTAGAWAASGYLSATGATSVVGTNGATFYITGVQLEAGTTASPFEYRQYGTELTLCQRYCVLFAKSTGVSQEIIGAGQAWGSTNYWCAVRMPVTMRSYPTMSATTGTNYWLWQSGGTSSYSTAIADPGYYGSAYLGNLIYITTVSGIPSGQGLVLSATANGATLLYTAEL